MNSIDNHFTASRKVEVDDQNSKETISFEIIEKDDVPSDQAKPPVQRPIFDFRQSFMDFIEIKKKEMPKDAYYFKMIMDSIALKKDIVCSAKILANVFGESHFKNKKIIARNTSKDIEGLNPVYAVLIFMKGLTNFYNSIKDQLSVHDHANFQKIFHAYHPFLLSAFIFFNQHHNQLDDWEKFGARVLEQDILHIQNNERAKGYWIPNILEHFVALRYEKRVKKLVVGVFNLDVGTNEINKHTNGKWTSETRFSKRALNSLSEFCRKMTTSESIHRWSLFLDVTAHYLKKHESHSEQTPQKIGDCSCRSQWALLKSEFLNHFGHKHPLVTYSRFKKFFQKQLLDETQALQLSSGETVIDNLSQDNSMSEKQIYNICLESFTKKKEKRIKEKPPQDFSDEEFAKMDYASVLSAITKDGRLLKYVKEKYKSNRKIALIAIRQEGLLLEYAGEKLREDKDFVLTAIKNNIQAIEFASEKLLNDREFILAAVKLNALAFAYATEEFQKDREITLAAVRDDGLELEFASEELRDDEEVARIAVQQNRDALRFVSERLKKNPECIN